MKKLLGLIILLFSVFISYGQIPNDARVSNAQTKYHIPNAWFDLAAKLPIVDTLNNKATPYVGALTILPTDTINKSVIPPIYISNGIFWGKLVGGGGGSGVDSVTFPETPVRQVCIWSGGFPQCYSIGGYYDSTSYNNDSTYYYHFSNGTFVDSVWIPFTKIFVRETMGVTDTTSNGYPAVILSAQDHYVTADSLYYVTLNPDGSVRDSTQWSGLSVAIDSGRTLVVATTTILQSSLRGGRVTAIVTDVHSGGTFNFSSENLTDDYGITFPASGGGHWVRDISQSNGTYAVSWFGALEGGDAEDNLSALNAVTIAAGWGGHILIDGLYEISGTWTVPNSRYIEGKGNGLAEEVGLYPSDDFPDGATLIDAYTGYSYIKDLFLNMGRKGGNAMQFNGDLGNNTITHCKIKGVSAGYWGIKFLDSVAAVNGVCCTKVRDNMFIDFDGGGIFFNKGGDNVEITGNIIQLLASTSYNLNYIGVSGAANLIISGNTVTGGTKGMRVTSMTQTKIFNNQMEATTVIDNDWKAMIVLGDVVGTTINDAYVANNNLNCQSGTGRAMTAIYMNDVAHAYVSNNAMFHADTIIKTGLVSRYITYIAGYDFLTSSTHGVFSDTSNSISVINPYFTSVFRGNISITGDNLGGLLFGNPYKNATSFLNVDADPHNTTSNAAIRLWVKTNTSGTKSMNFYPGDGTTTNLQHSITIGNSYFHALSGNLGVGTISPAAKLHVVSTTEPLRLGYDATSYVKATMSAAGGLSFIGNTANTTLGSGSVGVGTVDPFSNFSVLKKYFGSTSLIGITSGGEVQSTVTGQVISNYSILNTAADTFNLTSFFHYRSVEGTIGAGSSVTNQYGFYTGALTGATNNYGFRGDMPTGYSNYNLFTNGAAPSFHFGSFRIGRNLTADRSSLLNVAQSNTGIGTISTTAGGTTVTGHFTTFTGTFYPGQTITANGETRTIASIANDSTMTTDAWTNADTSVAYTLTPAKVFTVNGNGRVSIGSTTMDSLFTVQGGVRFPGLWRSNTASDSMLVWKISDGAIGYRAIPTYEPVITPPNTTTKYLNGYKQFVSLNSDSLTEGSTNLFYTTARSALKANLASPTFTGTVTIPTPFTLGATSVTSTGTQLNYLNAATGTTGTASTNLVYSASPTFTGTITASAINASLGFTSTRSAVGSGSLDGIIVENFTAATSGSQFQNSTRSRYTGRAWNGSASIAADFIQETVPVPGSGSITSYFKISSQINAGGYNEVLRISDLGKLTLPTTVTAAGTTGAQTINKPTGQVNFAAGATTLVVTNSLATLSSQVHVQVYGTDATATSARVTRANGSFTITLNAAATAETAVTFWVINN